MEIVSTGVGLVWLVGLVGLGLWGSSSSVPAFDPDSLERTKKWAETKHRSLEKVRSNSFIYKEKRAAIGKELQSFVGQEVSWQMTVARVSKRAVWCDAAWSSPNNSLSPYLIIRRSEREPLADDFSFESLGSIMEEFSADLTGKLLLSIGEEVSEETARTLMPGEVITIKGEIIEAEVDVYKTTITLGKLHAR